MATRINVALAPGERIELYTDESAEEPYFVGVISRVLATRELIQVTATSEQEAPTVTEVEEEPVEPGLGIPRPRGWH